MQVTWSSGEAYDRFMGRWSRPVGARFLDWLGLGAGLRWADVGCGTGALSQQVMELAEPASLLGLDPSQAFLDEAARRVPDPRASFRLGTAEDLSPGSMDVVVSGLVLNFVPDPEAAVAAMCAAAPDGTVAAYVWDYAEGMRLLRLFWDAATELDEEAAEWDEGVRMTVCDPDRLAELWRAAGADDVSTTALVASRGFASFEDLWEPFLAGQGTPGSYVATLGPDDQERLREALRDRLEPEADDRIVLEARAWGVRGRAPAS